MGWTIYTGEYLKQEYDIKLNDGTIIKNCWPNAGYFHELLGECRLISEDQIDMIRPSSVHSLDLVEGI